MLKWRKYWKSRPGRDEISVERRISPVRSRRPVRDGMVVEKYCVPNGTHGLACASVFYRYLVPNGTFRDELTINNYINH